MAPRKASKKASQPVKELVEEIPEESDDEAPVMEEEFHTEDEDEDLEDVPELDNMEEEYHTASSEASPEPTTDYNPPLLPLELLRAKPEATKEITIVDWEKMTRSEKKALRDQCGISMKQLREEVIGTGVIEAGLAAQRRRGIRPANKVAGSRVAKKTKRKGSKTEMSGKQRVLKHKSREAATSGNSRNGGSQKRKG